MFKEVITTFESAGLRVEGNVSQDLVTIRLNEYVESEEESNVYVESDVVEVYVTPEELKEIISSLQNVLDFFGPRND